MPRNQIETDLAHAAGDVLAISQDFNRLQQYEQRKRRLNLAWEHKIDRQLFTDGHHEIYYDRTSRSVEVSERGGRQKQTILVSDDSTEVEIDNLSESEIRDLLQVLDNLIGAVCSMPGMIDFTPKAMRMFSAALDVQGTDDDNPQLPEKLERFNHTLDEVEKKDRDDE